MNGPAVDRSVYATGMQETAVCSEVEYADDPPEWLRFAVEQALDDADFDGSGLQLWIPTGEFESSSLVRLPRFPVSIDGEDRRELTLSGVRNEQQSAQLAVTTTDRISSLSCSVGELSSESGRIPAENITTRFVGYVPVERALGEATWSATLEGVAGDAVSGTRRPDVVGDPLLEWPAVDIPPYQTQPVWITVDIPADVDPGEYTGAVTLEADDCEPIERDLRLTVREPVLPEPSAFDFHLDVWMCPDGIVQEYDVEPWSEPHWELLERYFEDLATRSQSAVTTTLVENPWMQDWLEGTRRPQTQSGYRSMVGWEYDGESWEFDFSVFDRYVEMARDCGVGPRIHAFGLLGFRPPEHLNYVHIERGERVKEQVEVGDDRWTEAWTAFFDDFDAHLRDRGWLEDVWLAIDERDEAILAETVSFLEDVAPQFTDRLSIAGSEAAASYADDLSLNTLYVSDIPLENERSLIDETEIEEDTPDVEALSPETIVDRRHDGKTTTFYTGGTPSHPNQLTFSPAVESRLLPWIAAEGCFDGYLCWSYTNWPEDVYANPTFQYVQGGEYLVYPGPDGPVSSIRWELLREGIEDYELLRATGNGSFLGPDERVDEAITTVTSELDGRKADVSELPRARATLVDVLTDQK